MAHVRARHVIVGWVRRCGPARAAVRFCRDVWDWLRLDVWILSGREKTSGAPLTMLFCGQLENKSYVEHLCFEGNTTASFRRVWRWRRDTLASDARCGHAIAIVERVRRRKTFRPDTFSIPCWIGGEIDFARAAHRQRTLNHVKADLRRIRKGAFDYVVRTSSEDILRFYDEMYVPYMQTAHGRRAFVTGRAEVEQAITRAELVLVRQHGEPVAGQVMVYEKDGVRGWIIGVKDGDRRYVQAGAIAALYQFTIDYLNARGFRCLHVGSSRAFLQDGVLRFKEKWGMHLAGGVNKWFDLTLLRGSEAVTELLAHNPFIFHVEERFYGAVFISDEVRVAPRLMTLNIEGLSGFVVFRSTERSRATSRWNVVCPVLMTPTDLPAPSVEMQNAKAILH